MNIKVWSFVGTLPVERKDETFKWKGVRYGRVNFAKLSLAQMVDIEEFYAMGFIENVHNILSILYLPTKSYNFITKKYTLETYEFNQEVANSFLDIDFDFVYGNLLFLDYRKSIYQQFEGLFSQEEPDTDDGDSEPDGNRQGFAESQRIDDERKQSKWNWIGIIYRLCDGEYNKNRRSSR